METIFIVAATCMTGAMIYALGWWYLLASGVGLFFFLTFSKAGGGYE